jgi:hypothetical protein
MMPAVRAVAIAAATAAPAHAQGVSLDPSVHIAQVFDDNVFNTPAAEPDVIVRAGARLDARSVGERRTIVSHYAIDGDRFARHPELTSAHARQDAGIDAQYSATRRMSLAVAAAYADTQTPAELNVDSAVAPGRARAERISVHPSATYQLAARSSATTSYTVAHDRMNGVDLTTQTATASFDRQATARDLVRWEYTAQRYSFDDIDRRFSQVVAAEWTRELTRATTVSLAGGPRLTDGRLSADMSAGIRRGSRTGGVSIAYTRTQTTLIGLVGVADTHGVTARFAAANAAGAAIRVEPALVRTSQGDFASTVSRVSIGCAWPIARALALDASYDYALQRGNLYAAQTLESIGRNVIMIRLVAAGGAAARRKTT